MSKLTKDKLLKRLKKLYKKEEYEKCLKTANKILKNYPNESEVYTIKIDTLLMLDKHDEFKETVCQHLKHSPKSIEDYLTAINYVEKFDNEYKEDLLLFEIIDAGIKRYPDSYDLLMSKLKTFYYTNKFQESITYIDSILNDSEFKKDLMLYKAKLHKLLEENDKALKVYNELLEDYPNDLYILSKKFKTLKILDRHRDVIKILNNMSEVEKRKVDALISECFYYSESYDNENDVGDNSIAFECIEKAIELDPENAYAHFGKATALYAKNEVDDAIDAIYDAIDLDETLVNNPDFNLLFGCLEYEYGDIDEAQKCLSKITFKDYVYEESMDVSIVMLVDSIKKLEEESNESMDMSEPIQIGNGSMILKSSNSESFSQDTALIKHVNFHKSENNSVADRFVYPEKRDKMQLIKELFKKGEIESMDDVELYDDVPEKRELNTIEDYETALNDFHNSKGDEYFKEHEGYLWKLAESRPYMMWLLGYSNVLWDNNEKEKAVDVLKYIIKLNPEDNQGVKDLLLPRLLELNKIDEFDEYNEKYKTYPNSGIKYDRLFRGIKLNLKDKDVLQLFRVAKGSNPGILEYLLGKKDIPAVLPDDFSIGKEDEAVYYVSLAYNSWLNDEKAIDKLKELSKL
ncbi:MAG: conserved hypothetical protein [Methanobrevibacter sp. CfCl-M3]